MIRLPTSRGAGLTPRARPLETFVSDDESAHARLRLPEIRAAVEHFTPFGDDLPVARADGADPPSQIVHADGVHVVPLDAERMLPVDLVGQRVPGEAHHRNPRGA